MEDTQKIKTSLKKAQGLIKKEIEMIENGEYCINTMQQNLAAIGLLRSAHEMLMETHLKTCFKDAMETGSAKKKSEMVEEILTVNKLFNR